MTYCFMGLNNFNMFTAGLGGWYGGFAPVMTYSYYNPFSVFNMAMQACNNNFWGGGSFYAMPSYTPAYYNNYNNYNYNYNTYSMSAWNIPDYAMKSYDSLYDGWYAYKPVDYTKNDYPVFGAITAGFDISNNGTLSLNVERAPSVSKSFVSSVYPETKPIYSTFARNYLNREFLNKVKQVAKNINCDYEDLLAVMNSESSLKPDAVYRNKNGEKTAVGLIQFTKNGAIPALNSRYGLDLTVEKIENMSALDQLDLVEKYYKMNEGRLPKDRKLTAADLYAVTFLPARAQNDVLTRCGEKYYNSNKGLDVNGDGAITKSDLNVRLAQKRVNLDTFV